MTAPRSKIEASLAERGRPAMWANEQETATLSGYSPASFKPALPKLEEAGFPQVNPRNGLRFIPAIIDFWRREVDAARLAVPESAPAAEQDLEEFGHDGSSERRSA